MMKKMNRREILGLGAGVVVFSTVAGNVIGARADVAKTDAAIDKFTGGASFSDGAIDLTTPEIAENGNTVPIAVSIESPMTEAEHVKSVAIFADGNPNPEVVTFNFTAASGVAAAKTRIRLAKTQNVIAIATMSDGSVRMAKNQVKVTIGGCGG